MCRYACAFLSVVVLVLAHVLVLMLLAGYLYGRLRDTDAKELLQLCLTEQQATEPGCAALVSGRRLSAAEPGGRAASVRSHFSIPTERFVAFMHEAEEFPVVEVVQQGQLCLVQVSPDSLAFLMALSIFWPCVKLRRAS